MFQSLFDLETAIEIRQVHKHFKKNTYNTIILARRAIKFLGLNFLYISKVLAFLDYILFLAKARDKIKSKKALTFSIKRNFCLKIL